MKSLLIIVIYSLSLIGCGNALLLLFSPTLTRTMALNIKLALGTALLSALWIILGLLGLLENKIIWTTLLGFALFGLIHLRSLVTTNRGQLTEALGNSQTYKSIYFWLALLSLIIISWIGILAYLRPPAGDAAAFYMVYPKIIAATGLLEAMPGTYHDFSSIGLSGELHFAILMKLGSVADAKFFSWMIGACLLFLLKELTEEVGGGRVAQIVAVAMLLTSTTYTDYLSDGKTDLFATFYAVAAIFCLISKERKQFSKELLILAGLLCGFAMSAKFSFIVALFPAAVFLLMLQNFSQRHERSWFIPFLLQSMLFMAAVAVALLPHFIKNAMLFGNPLAPFLGMNNWADQSSWYNWKDTLWIVATYPLSLVFGLYPLMGGAMSVLWIAAFALIPFVSKTKFSLRNPLMQLTLAGCFGLLCWIGVKPSIFVLRYFLAPLILLIPLPAIAVEEQWSRELKPRIVSLSYALFAAVILLMVPFLPNTGAWTIMALKDFRHPLTPKDNCNWEIFSYCKGFDNLNRSVPKGERVFLTGYYSYWMRDDLLQCINQISDFDLFSKPDVNMWSELYDRGFKHVAVQKATHDKYLKQLKAQNPPDWLLVKMEFEDSDMPIFHIESRDQTKLPHLFCGQNAKRQWKPLVRVARS
ncbi:ArnT family glycosyltransferase [Legionella jordanis]|uniref:Uncharacterized protein n=1 Tax=Legionella jordanis TaxID=456 RepID=A0A0W0VFV7_9GAMM|nr:glycosyltransferase family 39 protein [Legionella jordanis]KTD18970.1 hypothetical protein Ljor_0193 [Legionella jordanis]RMX05467.1 hypothetical protein EAW55_02105 [Legionella jordanis]RMX19152.1 hypothetical protein EAS68_06870 [Legionella jordanis]VEH13071.1 Uncharacterised protein [Legionella jordanis]